MKLRNAEDLYPIIYVGNTTNLGYGKILMVSGPARFIDARKEQSK